MKKLVSFILISILLLAAAGCVCGTTQTVTHRGSLSVAYDDPLTKELLVYFQANQDCIVTGVLLDAETDYETLADKASVAVIKDGAFADRLRAAGWTDTESWSDEQKKANEEYFNFTVLNAPNPASGEKEAAKFLTDWLVGDGSYDKTLVVASGCGCSCSNSKKNVTIKSDAPDLAKSGKFQALKGN